MTWTEGEEAISAGPNAVWQPMMDRGDPDAGLQHAEAALDVGQRLVAGDGLGGAEIGGVGQERQLAVEELRLGDGVLVQAVAEAIGGVVGLEKAGQFRLGHGAGESAVGGTIGGAATAGRPADIPGIEPGGHLVGHGLEVGDTGTAAGGLLLGAQRVMGDNEAVTGEGRLGSRCLWVTVSGIAGIATVSSQRRQSGLLVGSHSRLNTMARTRASPSVPRRPDRRARPSARSRPRSFQSACRAKTSP